MILDKDKIQKITLFENLTQSKVKSLIEDDKMTFIVENGDLGKAVGKQGKNVKMFEKMMHKKIKVIEFNDDPVKFINNYIFPVHADNIQLNNNTVEIAAKDRKTKGLLIGRERKNLNDLSNLVKSYFNLTIKIL
ncbi:MAG: NusA-like transcription termination signal-binding factor [Nanoarchaeota archaeon]